ncbi:MAG: SpoIID/LytB domain-containing protein, partial [Candidatus Binatia bacterium]
MRGACLLVLAAVLCSAAPARAEDDVVVLEGVGAAHGFGMAMDGVEGQARAGWSHTKILDLFYPGSAEGRAGGAVRVG